MRNLGEIPHPACKISLFAWNGKFLVKFEQGLVEQTLKFEDLELPEGGERIVRERLTPEFISHVLTGFSSLQSLRDEFLNEGK